jgi:hypothetical protein
VTRSLFVDETVKAYVAIEGREKARVCNAMVRTAAVLFDVLCPKKDSKQNVDSDAQIVTRQVLQQQLKRVTFGETEHQQPKMTDDDISLEDLAVLGESGPVGSSRNYGAAFCTIVESFYSLMHSPYYRMHDLYLGTAAFLGALVHQLHYYAQLYLPEVVQLLLKVASTCDGDDVGDAQTTEDLLYLCTHRWFLTVFADSVLKEHIPMIWHRFIAFGWKFVLQLALQILHEGVVGIKPLQATIPMEKNDTSPGAASRRAHVETAHQNHLFSVPPECITDIMSELPANITDIDATIRRSFYWRPRLGTATLTKLEREHISAAHAKRSVLQEQTD